MFNEKNLKPMLLKEIAKPFNDNKYLYEIKFDGIRAIIYVSKKTLTIKSRNGKDLTYLYPELEPLKEIVGSKEVIFDGEIVVFKNNIADFHELQARSHLKNSLMIKEISKQTPVTFVVFDILYENKNLMELPLIKRKEILGKYPDTNFFVKTLTFKDGLKLFKEIKRIGLEGIVAKLKESKYYPGKRVNIWLKIKNIKDSEFIILGYVFNKEKYSLYLGEFKNNKYNYVGKISVMPDNKIITEIKKLNPRKLPLANIKEKIAFIEPKLEVTVKYLEKTPDGKLRHPSLKE